MFSCFLRSKFKNKTFFSEYSTLKYHFLDWPDPDTKWTIIFTKKIRRKYAVRIVVEIRHSTFWSCTKVFGHYPWTTTIINHTRNTADMPTYACMITCTRTLISSSSLIRAVSLALPRNHLSDSIALCSPPGRINNDCGESGIHMNMPRHRIGMVSDTIAKVKYVVYGPTTYSSRNPATKKNCIRVPNADLKCTFKHGYVSMFTLINIPDRTNMDFKFNWNPFLKDFVIFSNLNGGYHQNIDISLSSLSARHSRFFYSVIRVTDVSCIHQICLSSVQLYPINFLLSLPYLTV